MANKIILKKSSVASKVPLATDLDVGEIAVNLADQKLYSKNASGTVITVGNGTGGTGTVTSVGMTVPTGLTVSGSPVTTSGTLAVTLTTGYSIPTTASQTNWDSAYTQRLQWDGGSTNLVAATGRTSLGGTTVGQNFFTLTNPAAITFPRINADNTVSALDAATFRTAIGAGTGSGTVTGVTATSPVASSGGTAPVISLASGYGDTQNPFASKTANYVLAAPNGAAGAPTFRAIVAADIPTLNQNTTGSSGSCTGNAATATAPASGGSFITSSNIGSQSVNYATSAGSATSATTATNSTQLGGSAAQYYVKGNGVNTWGYRTTNVGGDSTQGLLSGFYDGSSMTNMPTTDWYHLIVNSHYNSGSGNQYEFHIATPFWDKTNFYMRSNSPGAVGAWRKLLHDGNYNSYSPTLTGTGASGTWGINISGNAATATTAANGGVTSVNGSTGAVTVSGGQFFGTAATKAIAYNANSISENITITAGNNGLSAGPITINTGYTVTVATGAAWVIV